MRAKHLDRAVDATRDHVLGDDGAAITLVEYGSYLCPYCRTAHEMVRRLREQFGVRMRYVYRHLPLADRHEATLAAELAEYAAATSGDFWTVHDTLMRRGADLQEGELEQLAVELGVPPAADRDPELVRAAEERVRSDARSGLRSGARVTPTFFVNGRRYEGAWDEVALSEAMLRSLGHRLHSASLDFARWAPSTGLLLLLATLLALVVSNSALGPAFLSFWEMPLGIHLGTGGFELPVIEWVNSGLLSLFFLVVGLEIKRELTVGRLATSRAAALPIAAAAGGIIAPAVIYTVLAPEAFRHVWGATIATDTAFAVALLVLLGEWVAVELRVFLTAAVIVDDLVAIGVVALFYSGALDLAWLAVAAVVTGVLMVLSRSQVYRTLPYALLGIVLWFALHEGGLHATLTGVILAAVTPTRPPANLSQLMAQAQAVIDAETRTRGEAVMRTGPSEPALAALDTVHDRIESPASKLLRATAPWSSYVVLPIFALGNAGLAWSPEVVSGHGQLIVAIVAALIVGKLVGILGGARLAVWVGIAVKPAAYSWRQVAGAGALGGIGFTMSLFIAGQALQGPDYAAAKVAIFLTSLLAGALGVAILWMSPRPSDVEALAEGAEAQVAEVGSPVGGHQVVVGSG